MDNPFTDISIERTKLVLNVSFYVVRKLLIILLSVSNEAEQDMLIILSSVRNKTAKIILQDIKQILYISCKLQWLSGRYNALPTRDFAFETPFRKK